MSLLNFSIGLLATVLLVGILYFVAFREYEVKRFEGNADIRTFKNPVTENIKVVDAKTGRLLFWYNEDTSMQATKIMKSDDGKWQVVIEDIEKR